MARPAKNNRLTLEQAIEKYSKDFISNLYYKERLSTVKLAEQLQLGRTTLYNLLNYYDLELRQVYYDYDLDLVINNIDKDSFKKDIAVLGAKGAQDKYQLSRKLFYRVCDKLEINYSQLIKDAAKVIRAKLAQDKHEQTILEISSDVIKDTYLTYGFCGTIKELNLSRKTLEYYLRTYGKDIRELKNNNSNNSYYNNLFAKYLVERNVPFEQEFSINKKRFDFKLGNLLIEINPNRTHNLDGRDTMYGAVPFLYHQNRALLALENNFSIIHLYQNNSLLEFIEKYLEQSYKITSELCDDILYINLEGFCTLDILKAELEKFTSIPKQVVITESLNFCTLNLNQYVVGKVLPPQVFYIKDETIISELDYITDDKAYCISDAGKIVWTLGGDELNEICTD